MLTGVEHQLAAPRSGSQAQRMDQRRRFDDFRNEKPSLGSGRVLFFFIVFGSYY